MTVRKEKNVNMALKDSIVEMEIDTGEECECCFQKINSTVDKYIN
jgi:hypothetical protein